MPGNVSKGRRSRIDKYKKIIIGIILFLLVIPIIVSIFLTIRLYRMNRQLDEMSDQIEELTRRTAEKTSDESTKGFARNTIVSDVSENNTFKGKAGGGQEDTGKVPDKEDMTLDGVFYGDYEDLNGLGSKNDYEGKVKVYLTFDDGPSSNTGKILDVLAEYDVKATFFVTGKEGEQFEKLYQRIVDEGHTLGMHSYTHRYDEIYASLDAFAGDLEKLQDYLYVTTGTWSRFYRFPGGSSNHVSKVPMEELTSYLNSQNIYYVDWNIVSGDASGSLQSAKALSDRVLRNIGGEETQVVLFHDAAEKSTTVEALSIVLENLTQRDDVEILPITEDMDLKSVQHIGSDA